MPARHDGRIRSRGGVAGVAFKNLQLGGVQMETGDTGICQCKQCRAATAALGVPLLMVLVEDMALMYPLATDAIRSVTPDAWIVCETYSHPQPYAGADKAPDFGDGKPVWADAALAKFPRGVFVQWVADRFMRTAPSHHRGLPRDAFPAPTTTT